MFYQPLICIGANTSENMSRMSGYVEGPSRHEAAKSIGLTPDISGEFATLPECDDVRVYFLEMQEITAVEPIREAAKEVQRKNLPEPV